MKAKLVGDNLVKYFCPGCGEHHIVDERWQWNGDTEKPTLSPSVVTHTKPRCHSFVRNGKIEYLGDCEHSLVGQTVDMVDIN
jgi:hypothetical protein